MPDQVQRARGLWAGSRRLLRHRRTVCVALLSLLLGTEATASTDPPAAVAPAPLAVLQVTARFDPTTRETVVQDEAGDLCITFRLAREWTLSRDGQAARLKAKASGAELDMRSRSAAELERLPPSDLPQPDLAARDAEALLQEYQAVIGKPAQAVLHQRTHRLGVSRWSATWIDSNFASPSHSLTVETFIVDLNGGSALELTLTNVGNPDGYARDVARLLSSLQVAPGSACSQRWSAPGGTMRAGPDLATPDAQPAPPIREGVARHR